MTQRAGINFTDFDITDNETNNEIDISTHRLTDAELAEICSPLPGSISNLPVLFDETSAEYVIGLYKRADGKVKPVYRKEKIGTTTGADNSSMNLSISNIETITNFNAYIQSKNNNNWYPNNYNYSDYKFFCNVGQDGVAYYYKYGTSSGYFDYANLKFIAEYTKTTDEWKEE